MAPIPVRDNQVLTNNAKDRFPYGTLSIRMSRSLLLGVEKVEKVNPTLGLTRKLHKVFETPHGHAIERHRRFLGNSDGCR